MRNKEEILQSLDCLLNQKAELEEKIKETKQELSEAADAEMKRLRKELSALSKK